MSIFDKQLQKAYARAAPPTAAPEPAPAEAVPPTPPPLPAIVEPPPQPAVMPLLTAVSSASVPAERRASPMNLNWTEMNDHERIHVIINVAILAGLMILGSLIFFPIGTAAGFFGGRSLLQALGRW